MNRRCSKCGAELITPHDSCINCELVPNVNQNENEPLEPETKAGLQMTAQSSEGVKESESGEQSDPPELKVDNGTNLTPSDVARDQGLSPTDSSSSTANQTSSNYVELKSSESSDASPNNEESIEAELIDDAVGEPNSNGPAEDKLIGTPEVAIPSEIKAVPVESLPTPVMATSEVAVEAEEVQVHQGSPFAEPEAESPGRGETEEVIEAEVSVIQNNARMTTTIVPSYENLAAKGGAIGAVVLGLMAILGSLLTPASLITAFLGVGMGIWGLFSRHKRSAIIGLSLCAVAMVMCFVSAAIPFF